MAPPRTVEVQSAEKGGVHKGRRGVATKKLHRERDNTNKITSPTATATTRPLGILIDPTRMPQAGPHVPAAAPRAAVPAEADTGRHVSEPTDEVVTDVTRPAKADLLGWVGFEEPGATCCQPSSWRPEGEVARMVPGCQPAAAVLAAPLAARAAHRQDGGGLSFWALRLNALHGLCLLEILGGY